MKGSAINATLITSEEVKQQEILLRLPTLFESAILIKGILDIHWVGLMDGRVSTRRHSSEMKEENIPDDGGAGTFVGNDSFQTSVAQAIKGQWYAVVWEASDYWFVGHAIKVRKHHVTLEFVHQTAPDVNNFKSTTDVDTVPLSHVLLHIDPPMPISSSRCSSFKLQDPDFKLAKASFRDFVGFSLYHIGRYFKVICLISIWASFQI